MAKKNDIQPILDPAARKALLNEVLNEVLDRNEEIAGLQETHITPKKKMNTKALRTIRAQLNIRHADIKPVMETLQRLRDIKAMEDEDQKADSLRNMREVFEASGLGEQLSFSFDELEELAENHHIEPDDGDMAA